MPKPPVDPGYFDKVNYVIDAWTVACDAPWYIYVETMGPAALEAFITLLTFGWDDVARGFWRPRGLNPRRTGKRKGKWRRRIPRFPELGEEIGKRLPGADKIKGRKWGAGGKWLWRVDTIAQRALFWWLVVDVTIDFAFNWTSLLYETEWCKQSSLGRFSYTSVGYDNIPNGQWKLVGYGTEDYEFPFPAWVVNRGATGSNPATITAALDFKKHPAFPPPLTWQMRIVASVGGKIYAENGPEDADSDGNLRMPLSGIVPANTAFEVHAFMTGTPFALYGEGVVMGIEIVE